MCFETIVPKHFAVKMKALTKGISIILVLALCVSTFYTIGNYIKDSFTREYVPAETISETGDVSYSYIESSQENQEPYIKGNVLPSFFATEASGYTQQEINVVNILVDSLRRMDKTIYINSNVCVGLFKHLLQDDAKSPVVYGVSGYQLLTHGDNQYTVYPIYLLEKSKKEDIETSLNEKAKNFLYENEKSLKHDIWSASYAINNWITDSISYAADSNTETGYYPYNSIVGPFIYSQAICSGYAKTFCFLMGAAGYDSAYCVGYTNDGTYHAWNAVRYNDTVYWIDTTYNSAQQTDKYFFVLPEEMNDRTLETIIWYSPTEANDIDQKT